MNDLKWTSLACLLAAMVFPAPVRAQEEGGEKPAEEAEEQPAEEAEEPEEGGGDKPAEPSGPPADPARVLTDLTMANATKDVTTIDQVMKGVVELAKTSKDEVLLEKLGKELTLSLKACKGNWGTLGKVVDAMGELRTKETAKVLKKLAANDDPEEGEEEQLTARAILALSLTADPKNITLLGEQMKCRSIPVAKAAYEGAKHYAGAKGKDRRSLAEVLMKRIDAEYPSSGGQGGGKVSEEAQKRWDQVSPVIVASLQAVCGQATINDIENWRLWWKENKKSTKAFKDKET